MARQRRAGREPLSNRILSGYEGLNIPTDFSVAPVGIEDVDIALFKLFDEVVPIHVTPIKNSGASGKVPVVFASGERFATRMRKNPIRDENGQLILPIISIVGTGISQKTPVGPENNGMGMGTDVGDIVIKKRLSSSDRQYQSLVNKLSIQNQDNVDSDNNFESSTNETGNLPGRVASRRRNAPGLGEELLSNNNLGNNIFEIITIPFPTFFVCEYEVTLWSQYREHLNQMIERIFANYDEQLNTFQLETDKGYWFVAYFDDSISGDDNSDDFADEERVLKYVFKVRVPAYSHAQRNDADPIAIRRYVSAPQISFGIYESNSDIITSETNSRNPSGDHNKFVLSDVVPLDVQGNAKTGRNKDTFKSVIVKDRISGKQTTKFVKVVSKNPRNGETIIGADHIDDIAQVLKR